MQQSNNATILDLESRECETSADRVREAFEWCRAAEMKFLFSLSERQAGQLGYPTTALHHITHIGEMFGVLLGCKPLMMLMASEVCFSTFSKLFPFFVF
jgi:hypothetical protein